MDAEEDYMARQINPGDPFPTFNVSLTDGRTLMLPGDLDGQYAVIIYYRGIW
jgi:peroxiredoxin